MGKYADIVIYSKLHRWQGLDWLSLLLPPNFSNFSPICPLPTPRKPSYSFSPIFLHSSSVSVPIAMVVWPAGLAIMAHNATLIEFMLEPALVSAAYFPMITNLGNLVHLMVNRTPVVISE